ncbi:Fic family protein [Rhodococcus sp. CX]|uniref:Fic family protein n=1 Tax=unclassified Rhodococcus (in: high G+C Gram-positive bacteria) TaxID=192944 RepID=UPI0018CE2B0C|nr:MULTISPECIES: Fic family protein [unclassified Rhodococcus (in: high G+C Gram-positive bacteria)]MBH0122966.1 Fic family protein [Rhodococcus sp. CX]
MPSVDDGPSWPPVAYEQRPWVSSVGNYGSRRERHLTSGPYRAAVPAFIAHQSISLNDELQALAEEAATELTRFDVEVGHITAPFASILLRTESASSSEIENLTSGARQIALAELGEHASRNARLIVGNVRATQAALELSDSIDTQAVLRMHRALLEHDDPNIAGRWRREQVWIGGRSLGPHTAQFVPPHHDHISGLIDDLIVFSNRVDLPVMAQIAIAHAQFETIHPFIDGNGRVGRALIQAMLRGGRLTRSVTVPVSAGLLHNTAEYFEALGEYRSGNVEPIVRSIVDASSAAIANGRHLVRDLESVRADWRTRVKARRDSAAHRLVDLLLRQPVVDSKLVASTLEVTGANAQIAIDRLVDAEILAQITDGRRNRIWQAKDVVRVLDEFAARAKHRRG